tara:strand:+ start:4004 stop:4342 length:339 start_codon:yes stop_codon:yes gene_type:complete
MNEQVLTVATLKEVSRHVYKGYNIIIYIHENEIKDGIKLKKNEEWLFQNFSYAINKSDEITGLPLLDDHYHSSKNSDGESMHSVSECKDNAMKYIDLNENIDVAFSQYLKES